MEQIQQLAAAIAAACGGRGDGTHATAVPGVYVSRLTSTRLPRTAIDRPVLCVVAQGAKAVLLDAERRVYDPGACLVVSLDLPLVAEVVRASPAEPCLGITLELDLAEVAALSAELGPAAGVAAAAGAGVAPLGEDLLDAVLRLARLLRTPERVPVLAPLVRREIHYALLLGPQGALLRRMAAGDGRARRIAAGLAWLRRNALRPVRMADLAREVNMSPSAMHAWFKAVTTMSPLQYQKQLRLQEARRLLLTEGADAAAAARRVGYESASQFSREYRRLFGAPPMRDAERLRAGAA